MTPSSAHPHSHADRDYARKRSSPGQRRSRGVHRGVAILGSAAADVLAVSFSAGCGGSGTASRSVASPGATQVMTTVPGSSQHSMPLRAVQQASIPVPNLSWLSSYQGFVWVKRDDGFITRIDPRSNRPSGQVGAYTDQQHYCQGIGAGGGRSGRARAATSRGSTPSG